MPKIWFTSDLHLGHSKIINYVNRPFYNVEYMDKCLIANWNRIVGIDDTVYHIGDFTLNKKFEEYSSYLNGNIIFLKGNHDIKEIKTLSCVVKYGGYEFYCVHNPENINSAYPINLVGHVHCLEKTTELLTENGWKGYKEITIGEKVLTFNKNINKMEWNKIEGIVFGKEKTMLHFISRNSEFVVSENHNLIVKSRKEPEKSSRWKIRKAKDVFGKCFVIPTGGYYDCEGIDVNDDIIKLYAWFITEGGCYQRKYKGKKNILFIINLK